VVWEDGGRKPSSYPMPMNIVLIGTRCSGKTTVGKLLSTGTGKVFLDTDALVEEMAGSSIENLIATGGWETFRGFEKQVVEVVSGRDNLVIATGGGAVLDDENAKNLSANALVVWLDGNSEVLRKRMEKQQQLGKRRPALTGTDSLQEIREVLMSREPVYAQVSALRVDTTALSPEEVAAVIIEALSGTREESTHAR
jgi:shikimate kinase